MKKKKTPRRERWFGTVVIPIPDAIIELIAKRHTWKPANEWWKVEHWFGCLANNCGKISKFSLYNNSQLVHMLRKIVKPKRHYFPVCSKQCLHNLILCGIMEGKVPIDFGRKVMAQQQITETVLEKAQARKAAKSKRKNVSDISLTKEKENVYKQE